ncbi:MAG TPA: nitrilase-related carbon-nitrogen hydrolase [Bacteroidales bacterium]|nr:nitrilase-related carbon-nitrogen hydrolase [Bacteroidales bacterium]
MDPVLTLSLIQPDLTWEDPVQNMEKLSMHLEQLPDPVDLILLPETFNTGFSIHPERCAEYMNGPSVHFLREKSAEKKAVIIGSLLIAEDGKYYNRLIAMFPDGHYEYYDKRHLFRMSDENRKLTPGTRRIIIEVKGWKILPLVCYDLRFPVWSKNRMNGNDYEYDLLIYAANWPASRHAVWKSLLTARAIENLAFVAGVNRVGKDGDGTDHLGESVIVDHKGFILGIADKETPSVVTAAIDRKELEDFRRSFPVGLDWDQFIIR